MEITINARHCNVPDSLRNQAMQRLARLARIDRRITAVTLVLDGTRTGRRAEARITVAGAPPLIAHTESATLRGAMDGAIQRVERQLKRRRQRTLDRRTRRVTVSTRELLTP